MESAEYSVVFDDEAAKDLGNFGKADRNIFGRTIRQLTRDRRAGHAARLQGTNYPLWRAWAGRDLRVVYVLDKQRKEIRILAVERKHEDTYSDIKKWEKRFLK